MRQLKWILVCAWCVCALGVAQASRAATVTIAWDPNPEDDIAGYAISYGNQPGIYTHVLDVGNRTSQMLVLADDSTYFFVVRAYNRAYVFSAPSIEISTHTSATSGGIPNSTASNEVSPHTPATGGGNSNSSRSNEVSPHTSAANGGNSNSTRSNEVSPHTSATNGGNSNSTSPLPGVPFNLTSSVSGSTVLLTWSAPRSGAELSSYVLGVGSFSGGDDVVAYNTGNLDTSYTAFNVGAGNYFVRVRAANASGVGAPSNEVLVSVGGAATMGAGTLGSPDGLSATAAGSTVTLTWNAPTQGGRPTAYRIDAGSSSGLSDLASFSTAGAATAVTATGVPAGTYYVRIQAEDASGTGPASNEVALVVEGLLPCSAPAGNPTGLRAAVKDATVTLTWSPANGSATSYIVEVGSLAGATDLQVTDTGNSSTSLTVPNVASGTYFVRTRVRNACGVSGPSNEIVVFVP